MSRQIYCRRQSKKRSEEKKILLGPTNAIQSNGESNIIRQMQAQKNRKN